MLAVVQEKMVPFPTRTEWPRRMRDSLGVQDRVAVNKIVIAQRNPPRTSECNEGSNDSSSPELGKQSPIKGLPQEKPQRAGQWRQEECQRLILQEVGERTPPDIEFLVLPKRRARFFAQRVDKRFSGQRVAFFHREKPISLNRYS
jgi:hypothetical protein